MDLRYFQQQFQEVDDSLANLRRGVITYGSHVDLLEGLCKEISVYVESTDDPGFLAKLANGLVTQLQTVSQKAVQSEQVVQRYKSAMENDKAILADTVKRLDEVKIRETTDLAPKLNTAINDKRLAETQLRTAIQQLDDMRSKNDQSQRDLRSLGDLISRRTTDQKETVRELEQDLEFANKRLEAITKNVKETNTVAQTLKANREAQRQALDQRIALVADSVKGSDDLLTVQQELRLLLQATEQVAARRTSATESSQEELSGIGTGDGPGSPVPSSNARLPRPKPPGNPGNRYSPSYPV